MAEPSSPRQQESQNTPKAGGLLLAAGNHSTLATALPRSESDAQPFLREYGFWEYTAPATGGFETYDYEDYLLALDDMTAAGMNSLMIVVKWLTTGYRSRLPFLDQSPDNKVIASNNELLRRVIREAKERGIKVWLGAVTCYYDVERFGSAPTVTFRRFMGVPFRVGVYDPDSPWMIERGAAIFEELLDEFPETDGLMLEMERSGARAMHRVSSYNHWAKANGRPDYDAPETTRDGHWFDYQTSAIIRAMKAVENAVRAKGFHGDLATINRVKSSPVGPGKGQRLNIEMMRRDCPDWATINYVYDKGLPGVNYDGYMEAGVAYPKSLGINTCYLPRGVMTYDNWTDRQRLERSWAQDVRDVLRYRPRNLWWFGAGGKKKGTHVRLRYLRKMGFRDDIAARRELLRVASPLKTARV
jgi:hypothetical protein